MSSGPQTQFEIDFFFFIEAVCGRGVVACPTRGMHLASNRARSMNAANEKQAKPLMLHGASGEFAKEDICIEKQAPQRYTQLASPEWRSRSRKEEER